MPADPLAGLSLSRAERLVLRYRLARAMAVLGPNTAIECLRSDDDDGLAALHASNLLHIVALLDAIGASAYSDHDGPLEVPVRVLPILGTFAHEEALEGAGTDIGTVFAEIAARVQGAQADAFTADEDLRG